MVGGWDATALPERSGTEPAPGSPTPLMASLATLTNSFTASLFFLSLNLAILLDSILPLLFLLGMLCLFLAPPPCPQQAPYLHLQITKPHLPQKKAPPFPGSHPSHFPGLLNFKILSESVSFSPSLLPAPQLYATIISNLVSHEGAVQFLPVSPGPPW